MSQGEEEGRAERRAKCNELGEKCNELRSMMTWCLFHK